MSCGYKGPPSKSWYLYFPSSLMPKRSSNSMALLLPSSSGLCSLTRLDLSNCNLGEGVIPCDFFPSLLSLYRLNLSSNNFVSLPASINRLSKLRLLYLNDCKKLQCLPELPSTTCRLDVNGSVSLEISSNELRPYNGKWLYFNFLNCWKLFDRKSLMFSMLKDFFTLKVCEVPNRVGHFSMVVPGSEIPEWLMHQSEGSSISIDRPPDLYNNKLEGYVACCVFVGHKHQPMHEVNFRIQVDGRKYSNGLYIECGQAISEHLWLVYSYPKVRFGERFEEEYNHVKFRFERIGQGLEVKRCGVHPIYEQDMKEFNPTKDVVTTKRSLTLEEYDEAEEDQPK